MMRNFNEANRNEDQDGADSRSANRAARSKSKNSVITYAQAQENGDKELVSKMEKAMDPIDKNPESFNAILNYGSEPLEELGKVATNMIAVQKRFDEHVNVMNTTVEGVKEKLKSMNLKEMVGAVAKFAGETAGKGAKGTWGVFKAISDGLTGAKAKRTEEEQLVSEMQQKLPGMLDEMLRMIQTVQKVDKGIEEVMKEAEKLGVARIDALRGLNMYLGTKDEVFRRYKEEYIPEAKETFDETGDPEDENTLSSLMKREHDFNDRMMMLESSRALSINQAQKLKMMLDTMETQRKILQNMITNGQNEWKAMLMEAGIAGSSLKAAEMIKNAHEFGDAMHQDTMKMTELTHEMTLNAETRGTVDPKLILESMQRMEKLLEKADEVHAQRQLESEQMQRELRAGADKLLEAASKAANRHLLEAEETTTRKRGADKANDNVADAANADKPARKRGGEGPKI